MQSDNKLFADFARIMNGAAGTFAGMGREASEGARERAKQWFAGMDFVSREEFDAVKQMAATAREEAEALKQRVAELEAAAKPKAARRSTAAKKSDS
ncbi:MAG: accessory factor UbiK family protein [Pseudomonadota bacterium]